MALSHQEKLLNKRSTTSYTDPTQFSEFTSYLEQSSQTLPEDGAYSSVHYWQTFCTELHVKRKVQLSITHQMSRQSSILAWGSAWPGKGRWPEGRRVWSWWSHRLWRAPPGAAYTVRDRWPMRWHMCTAWRWRHSGWRWKKRVGYRETEHNSKFY